MNIKTFKKLKFNIFFSMSNLYFLYSIINFIARPSKKRTAIFIIDAAKQ